MGKKFLLILKVSIKILKIKRINKLHNWIIKELVIFIRKIAMFNYIFFILINIYILKIARILFKYNLNIYFLMFI